MKMFEKEKKLILDTLSDMEQKSKKALKDLEISYDNDPIDYQGRIDSLRDRLNIFEQESGCIKETHDYISRTPLEEITKADLYVLLGYNSIGIK